MASTQPPPVGGLLEESSEYEQRLVESRRSGRQLWELGITGMSVQQESGSKESIFYLFGESHRMYEEWRAGDYEPMSYDLFKEYEL